MLVWWVCGGGLVECFVRGLVRGLMELWEGLVGLYVGGYGQCIDEGFVEFLVVVL